MLGAAFLMLHEGVGSNLEVGVVKVGVAAMLLFIIGDLLVRVGQVFGVVVIVGLGQGDIFYIHTIGFLVSTVAVDRLQVIVQAAKAVQQALGLHGYQCVIDGSYILGAQCIAGFFGSITQSENAGGFLDGLIDEVVGPGFACFAFVGLLVQGIGVVQTALTGRQTAQRFGIALHTVEPVDIVIVQISNGKGMVADLYSLGCTFANTAVGVQIPGQQNNADNQDQGNDNDKDDRVDFKLFCLFLLGQLTFGQLGELLFLAELFLVGCAHVIISSHCSIEKARGAEKPL